MHILNWSFPSIRIPDQPTRPRPHLFSTGGGPPIRSTLCCTIRPFDVQCDGHIGHYVVMQIIKRKNKPEHNDSRHQKCQKLLLHLSDPTTSYSSQFYSFYTFKSYSFSTNHIPVHIFVAVPGTHLKYKRNLESPRTLVINRISRFLAGANLRNYKQVCILLMEKWMR